MKKSLLLFAILCICAGALAFQAPKEHSISSKAVILSPQQRVHILYGDKKGGGHFHTANKPCKSEFPESWNEDKIIQTIEKIAANDNMNWRQEKNGYFVGEKQVESLKIRVVLDQNKKNVITAYPVNVTRNPCPANDNSKD